MYKLIFLFGVVLSVSAKDIPVRDVGVKCDGRSDDTGALNRAIESLQDGDALVLPADSICPTSAVINIKGKRNIKIIGQGPGSVIQARRAAISAIWIQESNGITLENFKHESPYTRRITWNAHSTGVTVNASSTVKIAKVHIHKPSDHGIFIAQSKDVTVENCEITEPMHHGIHIQRVSSNVIVRSNKVSKASRDGISVIDWGSDIKSKNIQFLNNVVHTTEICGIRVGTAEDVIVKGNYVFGTFRTGIQMQCAPPNGNGLTNVEVSENTVENSPREVHNDNRWEAAIRGNTNLQILEHIFVRNNLIKNPKNKAPDGHQTTALQFSTANEGFINDLNILSNTIIDDARTIDRCVNDVTWAAVGELTIEGNTLRGAPCPDPPQ